VTEEKFAYEVDFYRQALIETVAHVAPDASWKIEVPALFAHFETLSRDNFACYRQVSAILLEDEQDEVRLGIIKLLQSTERRDTTLSALLVLLALKQKNLRAEALSALWSVGTHAAQPDRFLFAEKGYSNALYMIRHMLQTSEEIKQGITIARKYITAKDYELREAALFLLQKYSTIDREAEQILVSVQKYKDELFIDVLKDASPEMALESLKKLRSTIAENYAEYEDVSFTINVLEQKKPQGM